MYITPLIRQQSDCRSIAVKRGRLAVVEIRKNFRALIKTGVYCEDISTTPPGLANFRDRFCGSGLAVDRKVILFCYREAL